MDKVSITSDGHFPSGGLCTPKPQQVYRLNMAVLGQSRSYSDPVYMRAVQAMDKENRPPRSPKIHDMDRAVEVNDM